MRYGLSGEDAQERGCPLIWRHLELSHRGFQSPVHQLLRGFFSDSPRIPVDADPRSLACLIPLTREVIHEDICRRVGSESQPAQDRRQRREKKHEIEFPFMQQSVQDIETPSLGVEMTLTFALFKVLNH